jgi:hypothetical protein
VAGKPSVVFCQYALSEFERAPNGPPLPLVSAPLWSNDNGWTLVFNTCPKNPSIFGGAPSPPISGQVNLELLRIVHGGSNAIVLHQGISNQLSVFNATAGVFSTANLGIYGGVADSSSQTFTFVLRFDASLGRLYCHVNGINAISSPGYLLVGSMLTAMPAQAYIGAYFNYPTPAMEPHLAFASVGSLNCFLSWDRALSVEDTNEVGADVSQSFGASWQTAVYP